MNTLKSKADKIIELTVEEAKNLPGFLGTSVPAHLQYNGYRDITVDGVKTLYIKKEA